MHTKEVICWNCQAPNQVEDSAPELLEALAQMSRWFDDDGYATSVPPRTFVFSMRQAIRKAKGE